MPIKKKIRLIDQVYRLFSETDETAAEQLKPYIDSFSRQLVGKFVKKMKKQTAS